MDGTKSLGAKSRHYGTFIQRTPSVIIYLSSKAGTSTGRAVGRIVGANLASYTAELGGKVGRYLSKFFEVNVQPRHPSLSSKTQT